MHFLERQTVFQAHFFLLTIIFTLVSKGSSKYECDELWMFIESKKIK